MEVLFRFSRGQWSCNCCLHALGVLNSRENNRKGIQISKERNESLRDIV